jgi:hypothetical protein
MLSLAWPDPGNHSHRDLPVQTIELARERSKPFGSVSVLCCPTTASVLSSGPTVVPGCATHLKHGSLLNWLLSCVRRQVADIHRLMSMISPFQATRPSHCTCSFLCLSAHSVRKDPQYRVLYLHLGHCASCAMRDLRQCVTTHAHSCCIGAVYRRVLLRPRQP